MSTEISLGDQVTLPDTFYVITMIDSAADDIHQHVAALKRDATANRDAIRATAEGARWYSDFTAFDNQWVDWYAANRYTTAGLLRNMNGSSVGAVRNFGARFNALEARFRALGFTPTATGGPGPNPTIPDDVMHAIYAVGAIAGVGLLGWLAYSASKFAPAVNVAAERFRTFRMPSSMSGLGARPHRGHWTEEGKKKSSDWQESWHGASRRKTDVRGYLIPQFAGEVQSAISSAKRGDCSSAQQGIWRARNYASDIEKYLPSLEESLYAKIDLAEDALAACQAEHGPNDTWQRRYNANARRHGSMSRAR